MKSIDLNADIGEADTPDWAEAERDILDYVTSVNIACGAHAGDTQTMRTTLLNAKLANVAIGAHPSYPDRENFGRRSMQLGLDISETVLRDSLKHQITDLITLANEVGTRVTYVKPHGALYNDAVTNPDTARLIAQTLHEIDPNLIFMGAPDSEMTKGAATFNLSFIAEGFIDRRYTDGGHLQNRKQAGAVIEAQDARLAQALSLATANSVITATGQTLTLQAQSLCLHGDSAGAVETARLVRDALEHAGLTIQRFAHFDKPAPQKSQSL